MIGFLIVSTPFIARGIYQRYYALHPITSSDTKYCPLIFHLVITDYVTSFNYTSGDITLYIIAARDHSTVLIYYASGPYPIAISVLQIDDVGFADQLASMKRQPLVTMYPEDSLQLEYDHTNTLPAQFGDVLLGYRANQAGCALPS